MTPFSIAGLQLDLPASDNLDLVMKKIRATMARYPFVQMVVVSELAICGVGATTAKPRLGAAEPKLCALAKQLGIWLIPGSIFEDRDGMVFNTTPVINPEGEVITRYRKIYPFYPYEKGVTAGQDVCVFDIPDYGRMGVYICYDMWFPELSRAMVCDGAEVLLHPTLTDSCDRDVEIAMVRATAAQQQAYVIDVNGAGALGLGQSQMVGPNGDILYQATTAEEIILTEVDFDHVRRCRERGLKGLGQPLKSYRDGNHRYDQAQPDHANNHLHTLGKLELPKRGE